MEEIFSVIDKTQIDLELIIVDDNSPDHTGQIAEELSKKFPIKVVRRAGKLGLGSAVREGFSHSDRPFLGVMDADLSHDPKNINEMVGLLKDYDIVLGSRFTKGSAVEQWKWWRKIISKVGVAITSILTGVKDPLSGFFFLKREVIDGVPLSTVGYKILLEILVKGKQTKVKEVPIQFRIRKFSTSKLDKKEYWLFLKQIIIYSWYKIWRWTRKHKYSVGILIFAAALLVYNVSYRTFWGDETAVLAYLKQGLGEFWVAYFKLPDNHPPLYYFLVLLASKIFPWRTELTIRLVSILAGLGIVRLVYVFIYRVTHEKRSALLAAFFTALSSYFILISQMARYHSLAGFFSLLTFYFFYRLLFEKYEKRVWCWYLAAMVLTGYSDYPHFFYVALITNAVYLYGLIRRRPVMPLAIWFLGQLVAAILLSPLVWMIYHRIVIQGDGGWSNINLLANSWVHLVMAVFFHIYSFFFGENIFPWNYMVFGVGITVLVAVVIGFVHALRKKTLTSGQSFVIFLGVASVLLNTFFMNVADPRYNFIVYPKFGFVAYPLWVMVFVLCLNKLRNKTQTVVFLLWGVVAVFGLYNFYQAKNYLNPSYFRTFEQYEYVRDHSAPGQYLAITPNAGQGLYNFYKEKYFSQTTPIVFDASSTPTLPKHAQIWFFATGSEGAEESFSTDSNVPTGYKILQRFDSVPLDPTFKKMKEKILHRPSYNYKYSIFLLEKI